ncbi:ATP-grasp domain-containing protein [Streptomyces sp. A1547]|uniref:ATP-grasp domain-containing protein n=1 Tax=Streptomyces sp. A1547 TaxID=2563105 RepID=UPI00109ECE0E|nr:ATP-grasp domain-containing protein [Streptomyces sp. A1547]THA30429.1 ATP-grasp domain-containing protein [Streptomyces sp. A1547]
MTEHKLLVVGGRIQTLRKAAALGIRFVLIQHKDQFVPEAAALAEAVLIADYTDWDVTRPLVEAAQQAYGFTRVASITEPGLVPAGRISDHLGLGNTSEEVAELLRDKHAMRRHLAASPSPEVRALSVAAAEVDGAGALTAFGAEHGYPFVLKPVDATASLGVVRIDGPEQAAEAWAGVEALRARTDLQWGSFFTIGRFIAEQYIPGPEYSVESFSFAGRHIVLAVTEKLTGGGFIELGHALPARLDPVDERRIEEAVARFLDAMGLTDGAAHTELRLSPAGPQIIESHNRMGGDRIFDLLDSAYGIDLEEWIVAWQFGLIPALTERPVPRHAAATRFLSAEPGTVVEIQGADEARALPDVIDVETGVLPGDTVGELRGNWDRVGQVLVTGADTEAAVATAERLTEKVTVVTTPTPHDSHGKTAS